MDWTDPLCISRRLLWQAMRARARYARGRLLDIGCGARPYDALFAHVACRIGLDLPPNPRADIYASGLALPFRANSFDTVLCNEVLEHVPEPSVLMAEIARVLRPGGILILTTPQTWGLHHVPHDFYRYTAYGLRYLAEKQALQVLEVAPTSGFWATFTQRLADTVFHTYLGPNVRWRRRGLRLLFAPVMLAGYALDRLAGKRGDTLDYVLVVQKPLPPVGDTFPG
jgi:SAM-dependent methyltransferase